MLLCDISGLSGIKIAEYLKVDRAQVSHWRGQNTKQIADLTWNYIRVFFFDFLLNNY